ncbi:hypothetical protein FE257_006788 [Aspergillus nanangensis]|uniref:Xylanolytic transcriptional activator regulatory domain-containing protein n=1 Tax=Aspergillus nanangensis TaxID=2582783 RepID=A0AAD4GUN8_ASPNN|nr:hypothetical protein FE257_006788 [Aspergillus nanangensis]
MIPDHRSVRPSKRSKRRQSRQSNSGIQSNHPLTPPTATEPSESSVHAFPVAASDDTVGENGFPSFSLGDICDPSPHSISDRGSHSAHPPAHHSTHVDLPYISMPRQGDAADSYLGEPGYGVVYGSEIRQDADGQRTHTDMFPELVDLPPPELQQGFEETFFEYCYTWCPVIDRDTIHADMDKSPLVVNALSLAASHVCPPVIKHADPAMYYDRVKQLFYGDKEPNLLMCLKSIALVYWWSPRPPSRVHRDSSWWWTTVAIRHAQHGGFHREPKPGQMVRSPVSPGLRRRLWWTFFARERLTAICQCRPCVIDTEDCNIPFPTLDDFPAKTIQAEIFIRWVRLCATIGNIAKHLQRTSNNMISQFPVTLAKDLIHWAQTQPPHLSLPITAERTVAFNRDVHQLHLPYLAVIIVLHLSQTSSPQPLPRAYPAAILAASCIARILKDCLTRGRVRYLMGISCWYCGMAMLALLHARQIKHLASYAEEDLQIVLLALNELKLMWPTANIFLRGFERLRNNPGSSGQEDDLLFDLEDISTLHGIDWTSYFPFASPHTSALANILLANRQMELPLEQTGLELTAFDLTDLFEHFDGFCEGVPFIED